MFIILLNSYEFLVLVKYVVVELVLIEAELPYLHLLVKDHVRSGAANVRNFGLELF